MTDNGAQDAGAVMATLRQAADLLRSVGREHPQGPWRWADPDPTGLLGDPQSEGGPQHGAARGPDRRAAPGPAAWQADPEADPLTTFERLVPGPVPASARHLHANVVEPSLAGPLADLLDAVADVAAGSPGASATTETCRAAMRVARAVHTAAREASRS